jgi:hypothetical protein
MNDWLGLKNKKPANQRFAGFLYYQQKEGIRTGALPSYLPGFY